MHVLGVARLEEEIRSGLMPKSDPARYLAFYLLAHVYMAQGGGLASAGESGARIYLYAAGWGVELLGIWYCFRAYNRGRENPSSFLDSYVGLYCPTHLIVGFLVFVGLMSATLLWKVNEAIAPPLLDRVFSSAQTIPLVDVLGVISIPLLQSLWIARVLRRCNR